MGQLDFADVAQRGFELTLRHIAFDEHQVPYSEEIHQSMQLSHA